MGICEQMEEIGYNAYLNLHNSWASYFRQTRVEGATLTTVMFSFEPLILSQGGKYDHLDNVNAATSSMGLQMLRT
jgi:hypothetical protein